MFVPVSSPDGRFIGWIKPELIISVSADARYFRFRDGERISDGKIPYGMPDDLVMKACGPSRDSDTHRQAETVKQGSVHG